MSDLLQISHNCNTDKERRHRYISEFYEREFAPFRDRKIRLLEIGVYTGGSMKLWREYFALGEIWGIDREDNREFFDFNFILGDAYSKETVDSLPRFDIIIDDGSHKIEHQLWVIKNYKKKANMLIIEDVKVEILMYLNGMRYRIVDLRELCGGKDDIILVL